MGGGGPVDWITSAVPSDAVTVSVEAAAGAGAGEGSGRAGEVVGGPGRVMPDPLLGRVDPGRRMRRTGAGDRRGGALARTWLSANKQIRCEGKRRSHGTIDVEREIQ